VVSLLNYQPSTGWHRPLPRSLGRPPLLPLQLSSRPGCTREDPGTNEVVQAGGPAEVGTSAGLCGAPAPNSPPDPLPAAGPRVPSHPVLPP